MGKFFVFRRIKLKFYSWLYKKRWHTHCKSFSLKKQVIKKLSPKSLWQTYMKWTVATYGKIINILTYSLYICSSWWSVTEMLRLVYKSSFIWQEGSLRSPHEYVMSITHHDTVLHMITGIFLHSPVTTISSGYSWFCCKVSFIMCGETFMIN